MIIETNAILFRNIKESWLARICAEKHRDPIYCSYHDLKYEFFDWIKTQGATINRSRRVLSQGTRPFAYDDTVIIPGTDYIEFVDEHKYLLFMLKYT